MIIDPISHKVDPRTLTKKQAPVFIVFLESEVLRHLDDVIETNKLIETIKERFKL
jgi:hypothetical protein